MSVIRVNKNANYTCMGNYHLRDKSLSLKAKGLLSVILSLPDGWEYSISGLASICKEGEDTIKTTLNELKSFGYVTIVKIPPSKETNGRYKYEYLIYENPEDNKENTRGEKQPLVLQPLENTPLYINTKQSNTEQLNTEENIIKGNNRKNTRFVPPTVEEVEEYIREKGLVVNADYFIDYYQSKGWVVGRDKMKDWKATVRNWDRREQDKFKQQTTPVQRTKINPFDY